MSFKQILLLSISVLCFKILLASPVQRNLIKQGVLDLSKASVSDNQLIKLDGEWEFFSEEFIVLSDYNSNEKLKPVLKHVPAVWGKDDFKNLKQGIGFGTYHLRVIMNSEMKSCGLAFYDVFSAYKVFIDDELIASAGIPGNNKKTSFSKKKNICQYFEARKDTIHIFVQVSNFEHRLGGITKSPLLGSCSPIKNAEKQFLFNDVFSLSVLFISGIMFLMLFLFKRKEYSYLIFSLFSLLAFLRLLAIGDLHILNLKSVSFTAVMMMEYFSFYLLISLLVLYMYFLYPLNSEKKRIIIISVFYLILAFLSLIIPMYYLSWIVQYSKPIVAITVIYCVFYVANILKRKEELGWLMVTGMLLLLIGSLLDLYFSVYYIQFANYTSRIGIFLFVLFQIFLLLKKFVVTQNELEILTEDLMHVNNNLEKIVNTRTNKLKTRKLKLENQRKELKTIVKTKNKLFSIIGHDLRSPLGIANMYAETLLKADNLNKDQISMLKYIADSSTSALHLLNNLLMWGKSETGTVIFKPTYFDIQELIEESASQFTGAMAAKHIKLEITAENQILFADRFMIFLVMNNLLSNAVKFSEESGLIQIDVENEIYRKKKYIKISVIDQGVGMNQDMVDRVSNSNEYLSSRGTHNEKGSGLGLKICKDFIQQNNGKFKIISEKGKGTTVEILIPIKRWD
jgi:signal transduction histidine kinase